MKKIVLCFCLMLVSLSLSAQKKYKVVCCDGSTNQINTIGSQYAHSLRMSSEEFWKMMYDLAKDYCPNGCVRSVTEEMGLTLVSNSIGTWLKEYEGELYATQMSKQSINKNEKGVKATRL